MTGFDRIIGHRDVVEHLQNAMRMNRVSHAYLFCGEKGCGKRALAREFARALQCQGEEPKPCGKCLSCRQADGHNQPDIIEVTHDKPNSIGVEEIRAQVVTDVEVRPYSSRWKIYIISEAEKLTVQAQNALLKTVEEPPEYVVILLLTANAASLLSTIRSRCVELNMKPVPDELVRRYLMETVQIPDYEADICVAFAQGNIGKAVRLATSEHFSEIRASAVHLLTHVKEMDISEICQAVKGISEYKLDIGDYLDLLAVWYRDVLYFKATNDANGIIFRENVRAITEQTRRSSYEGLEQVLEGIQKARARLAANVNFELTMELLFLLIKENQ